jgi:hypothetical protein
MGKAAFIGMIPRHRRLSANRFFLARQSRLHMFWVAWTPRVRMFI